MENNDHISMEEINTIFWDVIGGVFLTITAIAIVGIIFL